MREVENCCLNTINTHGLCLNDLDAPYATSAGRENTQQ